MVKQVASLVLCCLPQLCGAITADELREISGIADSQHRQSAARLKSDGLANMLSTDAAQLTPEVRLQNDKSLKVKKYETKQVINATEPAIKKPGNTSRAVDKAVISKSGADYVPPPRIIKNNNIQTDLAEIDAARFGIVLGSKLQAKLVRDVSNVEPGLVELVTTQVLAGKRKSLPADSKLFALKQYNLASARLELHVVRGITPDGEEFTLSGLVFDRTGESGLAGIVSENNEVVVTRGVKRGLFDMGHSVLAALTGDDVVGQAAVSTGASVLDEKRKLFEQAVQTEQFIIRVAAQSVLIRVEDTF